MQEVVKVLLRNLGLIDLHSETVLRIFAHSVLVRSDGGGASALTLEYLFMWLLVLFVISAVVVPGGGLVELTVLDSVDLGVLVLVLLVLALVLLLVLLVVILIAIVHHVVLVVVLEFIALAIVLLIVLVVSVVLLLLIVILISLDVSVVAAALAPGTLPIRMHVVVRVLQELLYLARGVLDLRPFDLVERYLAGLADLLAVDVDRQLVLGVHVYAVVAQILEDLGQRLLVDLLRALLQLLLDVLDVRLAHLDLLRVGYVVRRGLLEVVLGLRDLATFLLRRKNLLRAAPLREVLRGDRLSGVGAWLGKLLLLEAFLEVLQVLVHLVDYNS
jgi:hypothetical protein